MSSLPDTSLKQFIYNSEIHTISDTCSICLNNYTDGDNVWTLDCSHTYHTDCITKWAKNHMICPMCRTQICMMIPKTDNTYDFVVFAHNHNIILTHGGYRYM